MSRILSRGATNWTALVAWVDLRTSNARAKRVMPLPAAIKVPRLTKGIRCTAALRAADPWKRLHVDIAPLIVECATRCPQEGHQVWTRSRRLPRGSHGARNVVLDERQHAPYRIESVYPRPCVHQMALSGVQCKFRRPSKRAERIKHLLRVGCRHLVICPMDQ